MPGSCKSLQGVHWSAKQTEKVIIGDAFHHLGRETDLTNLDELLVLGRNSSVPPVMKFVNTICWRQQTAVRTFTLYQWRKASSQTLLTVQGQKIFDMKQRQTEPSSFQGISSKFILLRSISIQYLHHLFLVLNRAKLQYTPITLSLLHTWRSSGFKETVGNWNKGVFCKLHRK